MWPFLLQTYSHNLEVDRKIVNCREEGHAKKPIGNQHTYNRAIPEESRWHQRLFGKLLLYKNQKNNEQNREDKRYNDSS